MSSFINQTFQVECKNMIYGGKCLANSEIGKKILVKGALPGEKVLAKISEEKKDYFEAECVEVLQENPNRVKPKCPLFLTCGGCNLQFASDEYQVELRKSILQNILEREKIPFDYSKIECVTGKAWNYRNRFQLHFAGFMQEKTNVVVPYSTCPVAVETINQKLTKEMLDSIKQIPKFFIFADNEGNFSASGAQEKTENKIVGKKNSKVKSGGKRKIYDGTNFSNSQCFASVDGKKIRFDEKGFFQSNLELLQKTSDILKKDFYGQNLLDFYAGVGTFSVLLSQNFKHTTLVEHNRDSLVYAQMNLQGIESESFGVSGEKFIELYENSKNKREFDALVIDPPRSGIEKNVISWICKSSIPRIRSISCDPVTHARDLKILCDAGYKITNFFMLDYYPQTSKIESMAFLEKN